ncbi:conserved protein, unknown function [Hepatocystis sp. ex Piliocolobus tephrosceles]|nr:conserved protein, unknown function [Hepatocystis sp. ex Piliocolobus tephrosceles]
MKNILQRLICLCLFLMTVLNKQVSGFNFNDESIQKKYLILQNAYFNCKNYNVINKKNPILSVNLGKLHCDEDTFCNYFLFNNIKKEIRLCYDKNFVLSLPVYDESWSTNIKEKYFQNFSPAQVNTQGVCAHGVSKYFFNTLNDAIKQGKEKKQNFMILNFQTNKNTEKKIEGYFCEMIDYFSDRPGYALFDLSKIDKPNQSILRTQKSGVRGAVQSDDSKYEEGINPGDIVEAHKF